MRWCLILASLVVGVTSAATAADELKLSSVEKLPMGLDDKIAAVLDPHGIAIAGADGPVCTIWLAKSLSLKEKFKPSLTVKYPFPQGVLAGAMEVHAGEFSDFRAQPVKPGVYTLRYGQQPQDGNHIGTSELSDFLLAIPAASDLDPAPLKVNSLMRRSAKATGSNHPAIYSLLPPDDAADMPALDHDAGKEFWILSATAAGKQGAMDVKVPLKLVVIGKSEG